MLKVVPFLFAGLIGAAIVSAIYGLIDSRADFVFLALLAWTEVVGMVRAFVIKKIDRTNGNGTSFIAFFLYANTAVACSLLAGLATLLGVSGFITFTVGSVLITMAAGWTAWMHA